MLDSASRRAEAGPPELGALGADDEEGAEEDAVVDAAGCRVDPGSVGAIVGAGVGFGGDGSGSLLMIGALGFSSCRGAVTAGRSTGFATSSKLDSLSLSDSSLSANFDAPAANDCLLSVIVGGGPREVMGAGAGVVSTWESC
jgi:hypothetical protein